MKLIFIVFFAFACLLAVSNAQRKKCDRKCPQQIQPVCATRDGGRTYRRFNNSCLMAIENCRTNNAYKRADLRRCKK